MPEDAFERFRRLRGVPQTDGAGVQTPPTEDTASMSPLALCQALHACGVRLIPYPDGTLRYEGHTGALPPALLDQVHTHTAALHALVEVFEERAAMGEYCGGLAREDAEWQAFLSVQGEYQP